MTVVEDSEVRLLRAARKIHETQLKKATIHLVWAYWMLGKLVCKAEERGTIQREYGGKTMQKVAAAAQVPIDNLYKAISFAEHYPSRADVIDLFSQWPREQQVSWTGVKRHLSNGNGTTREQQAEELFAETERTADRLEHLTGRVAEIHNTSNGNLRESASGVLIHALSAERPSEDSLPSANPKTPRIASDGFLRWIKTQPEWACILTGDCDCDAHHIRSVGAGGSDYMIFPLSRADHAEAHQDPMFYYRNRLRIVEWFYRLPALHARYAEEIGEAITVF